jgi:transcriptional regulator with XRE-family HTH domain
MLNLQCKYAVPKVSYAARVMETMGDRIRRLREAKHLTQPGLAKLVGVTKSAVCQWELGATANLKLRPLAKLLTVLGTDLPYLVWGERRAPSDEPPFSGSGPRRRTGTAGN